MTTIDADVSSTSTILQRNIRALAKCSPLAAEAVLRTEPAIGVEIVPAQTPGEVSGTLDGVWLASPRRPEAEADQLAKSFDPAHIGAIVVLGFGIGRHVRAAAERCRHEAFVIVFEPNVPLLRAVLERVDHSAWIERAGPLIITDPDDDASLVAGLRGAEAMLALGVKILEHTPSRSRLGPAAARFCETFNRVLSATRTTIVTTLVQSEVTCRNFITNSRAYLENPGIADLAGVCAGRPAITVAAGPSLARNMELLKTPGLRDRCVIIAAQTVLKPLLEIGVRPHFVTSLDFHEISARFYEGLTAEDVAGVTLVVEPKANPAIVRAFPGAVRMPREQTLDVLLGDDLAGAHGPIRAGATVAHLSYYLARHLGCDPVVLIGQDLGFTDGLYYADGAAIHTVWAGELNTFRSLEMLEWERVARHRSQLRKIPATTGGEIYTDEQMATYLAQFNRDFLQDQRRGLTTIDATEGGARKSNTLVMALADAIARHAGPAAPRLPDLSTPALPADTTRDRCARAAERITAVRRDLVRLASISRKTADLLARMLEHQDDQRLVNRLIKESHKLRDEAQALQPAFGLVQRLNQLGAFKRVRADRALAHADGLGELEIQRRRIERDKVNVEWIADASDMMASMLADALKEYPSPSGARVRGEKSAERPTRRRENEARPARAASRVTTAAVLVVDPARSSIGISRDLARPIAGVNALARTLARLARSSNLRRAVVVSPDPEAVRAIAGEPPDGIEVDFIPEPANAVVHGAIARARAFSRSSWRGGIAGLTIYDELLSPRIMRDALAAIGADAALVVGGDWPLVDPALCDAVIDRFAQSPDDHRLTFTQAPPGLAGCLLSKDLLDDIAPHAGAIAATVGGMLGYHPARPGADQIARERCATIPPAVRDALARFIADDPACAAVIEHLGDRAAEASAEDIARAWREILTSRPPAPEHVVIELALGKPPHGVWPVWSRHTDPAHRLMPTDRAESIIRDALDARPDAAITFAGAGDPLTHPDLPRLMSLARDLGAAAVHVRTPLAANADAVDTAASADILSVDLFANSAATYERITGIDRFRHIIEMVNRVHDRRAGEAATPWIVPRITRCDAALHEIEAFYDKWLAVLGAACIDPLPAPQPGARIAPLTMPRTARERIETSEIVHAPGADALPGFAPPADSFDDLIIEPGAPRR